MCSPSSPTRAPSRRSSGQWDRAAILENRHGAQHAPVRRPPIHFRPLFTAQFRASPCARAGPNATAVKDEGVSFPGELDRAQHAVVLLPDPRHAARGKLLSAHIQLNMPDFPHIIMLHMQAVGVKSLQAAERPADLAPIRLMLLTF
jgi:hypothetical protein